MIKISLISKSTENLTNLVSHAARICYNPTLPKMGSTIDIENLLFKTGHHTTLQHNFFTFLIDGLSINSTIFGLHLLHPFYNTDQRSGRFSKMYTNPDYDEIRNYILGYFPNSPIDKLISFIKKGRLIYKDNMKRAEKLVAERIKEERPFASDEYIEANANKIAQEQMRVFISTVFPTALDYTINLSTLNAIYRSAWTVEMKDITEQMKRLVLKECPNLEYMYKNQRQDNWSPKMINNIPKILKTPSLEVLKIDNYDTFNSYISESDSVDLKYFTPERMNNNIFTILTEIEVSLATMAHDQRHRTLKRTMPELTGNFYLPPIPSMLGLEKIAEEYMLEYIDLYNSLDKNLVLMLAPYGVMAKYKKIGDINAITHEQEKRLCWSSQEEVYNLSRKLYEKISNNDKSEIREISKFFLPSCYKKKCIEGKRYCGRDIKKCKISEPLIERTI
ncbi:MAG: FAD-dependent thymidylate synthase [Rickettsiales bacterium]|nr:FAD-dependent thymidylate synthase [Rickettsiales bacterium]